jgi:glycosyltransferase involved in cell wall biosynthesis
MSTSAIGSIIRAATRRPDEPLNILTFSTHEAYQSNLAKLPHHFYLYETHGTKKWNGGFRPLPANHTRIAGSLPPGVDLDLVWSQEKNNQYPIAIQVSKELQLPLVAIEHTLPHPQATTGFLRSLKQKQPVDVQVFISEYSRKEWQWEESEALVIHHGIDTDLFTPDGGRGREPVLLSVVNCWIERDWCCGFRYWEEATRGLPVKVLGDTPGLSKPAGSPEALAAAYRGAQIFVNTSTVSPVPTALLEAMASGCCVVSTDTCMIPEVVQHGVNGYLCDSSQHMKNILLRLLDQPEHCMELGQAARQTILDKFNLSNFCVGWDIIFRQAIEKHIPGVNK